MPVALGLTASWPRVSVAETSPCDADGSWFQHVTLFKAHVRFLFPWGHRGALFFRLMGLPILGACGMRQRGAGGLTCEFLMQCLLRLSERSWHVGNMCTAPERAPLTPPTVATGARASRSLSPHRRTFLPWQGCLLLPALGGWAALTAVAESHHTGWQAYGGLIVQIFHCKLDAWVLMRNL